MERVEVRELTGEDWKIKRDLRLGALLDAPDCFGGSYADSVGRTEEQWRAWPNGTVFAAYLDGEAVGMAAGQTPEHLGGESELIAMWVAPQARGYRIAGRLIAAVSEWARKSGGTRLFLEVKADNDSAIRAYQNQGFGFCDGPVRNEGDVGMSLSL